MAYHKYSCTVTVREDLKELTITLVTTMCIEKTRNLAACQRLTAELLLRDHSLTLSKSGLKLGVTCHQQFNISVGTMLHEDGLKLRVVCHSQGCSFKIYITVKV